MKLQIKNYLVASVALAAGLTVATLSAPAEADEGYIVSAEIVSDSVATSSVATSSVAAPAVAPANYVGDISYEGDVVGGCASGTCGSGECASGNCGSGSCADGSCLGGLGLGRRNNVAGCQPRKYDRSDLFYNYYSQGNCNSANAQMYVSPLPVPQFVGNTYFTYQPFYPHEMMYKHKDRYHNHYDNGRGLNRTKVKYSYPPVRTAVENLYWNKLRLPR
ncbi:hypothetical protein U8335_18125 [Roseiconus lacunae]|uniref:hypothetical protein n=1 Tax=Roseiconus lacunae TaxID=2605694 RepID=UPI00309299B9|nr:hypothetical protein U8335_18125 [Stieleria sp. HD01]